MAKNKREVAPAKRVGIGSLVFFDFFFGGLALVFGLYMLNSSSAAGPGAGFLTGLTVVIVLIGLGLVVMGALLFTRQMWAYQLAFGGHLLLFILNSIGFVSQFVNNAGNATPGRSSSGGGIFGLLLAGMCAHHAWKLVQQEKADLAEDAAERRRALKEGREVEDDGPEIEAEPGWDEGRK